MKLVLGGTAVILKFRFPKITIYCQQEKKIRGKM